MTRFANIFLKKEKNIPSYSNKQLVLGMAKNNSWGSKILNISRIQSKIQKKNLTILKSEGLFHIEQHILENK